MKVLIYNYISDATNKLQINEELPLTLYQAWLEEVDPSHVVNKSDAAGPLGLAVSSPTSSSVSEQVGRLNTGFEKNWEGGGIFLLATSSSSSR